MSVVGFQAWFDDPKHTTMMAAGVGAYDELDRINYHDMGGADSDYEDDRDDYNDYSDSEDDMFIKSIEGTCDVCDDNGAIKLSAVVLTAIYDDCKDRPPFEYKRSVKFEFDQTPHGWKTAWQQTHDNECIVAEWDVCRLCRKRFDIGYGY